MDGIKKVEEFARAIEKFLIQQKISFINIKRLQSGRNSRVWEVQAPEKNWIIKEYFRHKGDNRDRLGAEWNFLCLLNDNGISGIPKPLAMDHNNGLGLYSCLPGQPVKRITPSHIRQAARFILQVNTLRGRQHAQQIKHASEACFSIREHLEIIKKRLKNLLKTKIQNSELSLRFHSFCHDCLYLKFNRLEKKIVKQYDNGFLRHPLEPFQTILSPSDFGFHNMLEHNGVLQFFDFEYAGWDDPGKLFCDFAGQPDQPVTCEQSHDFQQIICRQMGLATMAKRSEVLMPFYRLKWCCILLNEFCTQGKKRREHAHGETNGRKQQQLEKSISYYNHYLKEK